MRLVLCGLLIAVVSTSYTFGQNNNVTMRMAFGGSKTLDVRVGNKPFAVFNYNDSQPKPYLWPLRAVDGTVLTRSLKNPKDHPHHKGVWVAVDKVNDVDFWAEKGKINLTGLDVLHSRIPTLNTENEWKSLDGKPIVVEKTKITVYPNRTVAYDITFVAKYGDVKFGDTKEGLFGFRMVDPLREKGDKETPGTGKVVNANGAKGTKECWGQPAAWVDYSGQIKGKTYGVALFDHPGNLRPSRYHVRNYGLFSISPFGEKAYTKGKKEAAPVTIKKGEELRLRYALYVHDGDAEAGKVADAYKGYVKISSDK